MNPRVRKTTRAVIACCLASLLQAAGAGPVTIGGLTSGSLGDTVLPTLLDASVTDFEAADIRLTFDPRFLSFISATEGTLTSGFSILSGPELPDGNLVAVMISLATGGAAVSGGPGSMLVASLLIKPTAPLSTTRIGFETLDASLYDFPATYADITVGGTPLPMPIGNTGVLVLTGLFAMVMVGRRQISS